MLFAGKNDNTLLSTGLFKRRNVGPELVCKYMYVYLYTYTYWYICMYQMHA